ncbi:uncharacterized protein PG986_001193 [Apiospora aurea]|uniref:Uncharacterized protein n=1 Tax=Apiospora aurea TaxID=335848 RepID=A0ABR1QX48_9PEZI
MAVPTSDDEPDNGTAPAQVDDPDHIIFGALSGPCLLCGRPSTYTCPFKADTFQCEFLCGWPVPRDIRARLRRIKEEEERQEAEFWGYEADDEKEAGKHNAHARDSNDAAAAETEAVSGVVPVGGHTTNDAKGGCISSDADDVDVYGEMHKTLFPKGVPRPPGQSKKPRGTATEDIGDGEVKIATSGKRKSKGHNEENSKDRPAKKQKTAGETSTTAPKEPANCTRLKDRHAVPERKSRLGFPDWMSWK